MEKNIRGSQDEPFYDLLHPSNSTNATKKSPNTDVITKQMDDLGFDKDLVLPSSYDSRPMKAHNSSEYSESAEAKKEKERRYIEDSTIAAIECSMKHHCDNLLHALESIRGRLSELEHRTKSLELTIGDLKMTIGNDHGETDGRMRMLENILREVQAGVQILRDKQEIAEARTQLEKPQTLKKDTVNTSPFQQSGDSNQVEAAGFSPQANLPVPFSFPSQPQTSLSVPASDTTMPSELQGSAQNQPNAYQSQQQHQVPSAQAPMAPVIGHQQVHSSVPSVPTDPQYQNTLASSAPPPPPPPTKSPPYEVPSSMPQVPPNASHMLPYSDHSQPPQVPGHTTTFQYGHSDAPPSSGAYPLPPSRMATAPNSYGPEPPYIAASYGTSPSLQPQPTASQQIRLPSSPSAGRGQQPYEQPFGRTFSGPSSGHPAYASGPPYGDSQSYSGPVYRPHQSDLPMQSSGSGHQRLPTAKAVQRPLPVATSINGSASGNTSSSNRVPVDDVIDKVTSMGFPRDQVKIVVRKLTENGQSVDLNIVLDKLMNGR
eukprot:TRINITY_DN5091_c0_g1_i1.p1 TRINITY_DN5091_c0_g1~~TRINITY_DN5091_c0_g1_i1.p1  ORF type:complete len:542 (-),score=120.38 TRINITY_DN5091_c0_g1_i1:108-1733(-)